MNNPLNMDWPGQRLQSVKWFNSDAEFHNLYPASVRPLAVRHWTPLRVARKAANFLAAENGVRVLDIGSGTGKFCLSGAYYKPDAVYYGVEQRKLLTSYAEEAKKVLEFSNVSFIHGNFTQLDLNEYDHFYFYNSFYENLAGTDKIDDSFDYSASLYHYYNHYLFKQLEKTPRGTRLATYYSSEGEVPPCFLEVGSEMDNLLKFWVKE
jgi:SAM-dependent methyltransferase